MRPVVYQEVYTKFKELGYDIQFINTWHNIDSEQISNYVRDCYKRKQKFLITLYTESCRHIVNQTQIIMKLCDNDQDYIKNYIVVWSSSMDLRLTEGTVWEDNTITGPFISHWIETYFGDEEHNLDAENKDTTFLCFNRIVRPHRCLLVSELMDSDLIENNFVSFFKNGDYHADNVPEEYTYKSRLGNFKPEVKEKIIKNIDSLPGDLYVDDIDPKQNQAGTMCPINFYEKSFFSLTTETFFVEEDIFFSEKIYKPMVFKHPFILVGSYDSLTWLHKMGFQTFGEHINEGYDRIKDPYVRMDAIVREIKRLDEMSLEDKRELYEKLKPICEHNYNHLIANCRNIIKEHTNIQKFIGEWK